MICPRPLHVHVQPQGRGASRPLHPKRQRAVCSYPGLGLFLQPSLPVPPWLTLSPKPNPPAPRRLHELSAFFQNVPFLHKTVRVSLRLTTKGLTNTLDISEGEMFMHTLFSAKLPISPQLDVRQQPSGTPLARSPRTCLMNLQHSKPPGLVIVWP